MYKLLKAVDRLTDSVLFLFFLLLFLIGAYTMYDSFLIYYHADDADLRQYKPIPGQEEEWSQNVTLPKNMVAWLTVDGTSIDYPVMQGETNNEYLNKDPLGNYALSGSIFLDSRNAPDFTDPYSLIYGHHMEYGKMFGSLDSFMEKGYFDAHRTATLTFGGEVHRIKFFACLVTDGAEKEVFAPTETDGTLEYVRQHASIWYEPEGERLIALSTCKHPQTTDRFIVFGVFV